jgi:NitT/TauT family transport system permease protein
MKRLADIAAPLLLGVMLLSAWEIACRALEVPTTRLAPPTAIGRALVSNLPALLASAGATFSMALQALILATAAAAALAIAAALSPIFERAVRPLAVTLQVTPVIAIAPLVVIWAGLDHSERAVVGLAAVIAFFPVFSGLLTGLNGPDPDLLRLFRLYGAGRLQTLVRLRLPSSLPSFLEGLRVSAGLAVIGTVTAEFVAGSGAVQGLAWRIIESGNRLRTADMFAAVFVLAALALVLHAALTWGERLVLERWSGRRRR